MRNFTPFIVFALLVCTARAGEVKKTAPVAARSVKATAKASISARAAEKEDSALKKASVAGLKDWDAKLLTLRARFTQEVDFSEAGLKQHIEGLLSYMKPDRLKIEHIKPARQLVYTDKKELWIYKPEDSQAVRTSWNAWKKNQSGNFSGILDFGNYASLTEQNDIRVSKDAAAPYYITMVLTPKSGAGAYSLTLALSSTDYFPAEAALSMDGTIIRTRMENTEKNAALDPAIFGFVPPKGTEVIEFNN